MKESDIVICGHGSGNPSTKRMDNYLTSRYKKKASNGKRKGIIKVMRLKALTDDGRKKFHDTYKTILGRNVYSQSYRSYVYTPYKGKYYSDCSSSGCATFKKIGYDVPLLNTAGIYQSSLFEEVKVKIVNGHVTNPEVLKVGDALLFVGSDASRPLQIGHVEYVYQIKTSGTSNNDESTPHDNSNATNSLIKIGQQHANNFVDYKITVDGISGIETNKMKTIVLQRALNLDYNAGLSEDGKAGTKTKKAIGNHYIKKGETQYMVTAAEILMYLNETDPNGVECPGKYGNGLVSAAKKKFGGDGTCINSTNFLQLL